MIDGELDRRQTLAAAEQKIDTIVREVLSAEGVLEGDEWEPGKSYPRGWTVTCDGMKYSSKIPNNAWSPSDYPHRWEKA